MAQTWPSFASADAALRKEIQIIFQDDLQLLNRHTVGTIIVVPLRVHYMVPETRCWAGRKLLEVVGSTPAHYNRYPQRVLLRPAQRLGTRGPGPPAELPCSPQPSPPPRSTSPPRRRSSNLLQTCRRIQHPFPLSHRAHDLSVVAELLCPRSR